MAPPTGSKLTGTGLRCHAGAGQADLVRRPERILFYASIVTCARTWSSSGLPFAPETVKHGADIHFRNAMVTWIFAAAAAAVVSRAAPIRSAKNQVPKWEGAKVGIAESRKECYRCKKLA